MGTILILVDFSKSSLNTVDYGVEFALKYNYKIILVYIFLPNYFNNQHGISTDLLALPNADFISEESTTEWAEGEFNILLKNLKEDFDTLPPISFEVKPGLEISILQDLILEKQIKFLLLTGKKENNGLINFFGNTINVLIEEIKCPILIIQENCSFKSLGRIVYATDYHEEDITSLSELSRLAAPFHAYINALHIVDSYQFNDKLKEEGFRELLREKVGYTKLDFICLFGSNVVGHILEYAAESQSEMIAVLKENKGFLKKIFEGSISEKIARMADIPVLVFHQS